MAAGHFLLCVAFVAAVVLIAWAALVGPGGED